jgi:pyruvate dehydrogenase E2 component (dihydrolipoamide acetyltransferase)
VSEPEGLKGAVEVVEPTRAERTIARRAAETRATVPDLELSVEIDIDSALALARADAVSLTALLVRASALALRKHPRANAACRDGRFELYSRINAGLVLASGELATVLDADHKTAVQLTTEIEELEQRADELAPPQRSGATFTLARHGVTRAYPLLMPPHAVALAAGEVREVAIARAGEILAGHALALTLACDHRILYGTAADALLRDIRELLERADLL